MIANLLLDLELIVYHIKKAYIYLVVIQEKEEIISMTLMNIKQWKMNGKTNYLNIL